MLYEVEVRNIIKPKDYKKLAAYLQKNGKYLSEVKEETVKYDVPNGDLRLRLSDDNSYIIFKTGKNTHEVRPEMEVEADIKKYQDLQFVFASLNFPVLVRWIKKRKIYRWQGTKVYLDNVKGQGLWIEIEKLVDSREKLRIKKELQDKMTKLFKKLAIPIKEKKDIDKAINDYQKNWQKIINKNFSKV